MIRVVFVALALMASSVFAGDFNVGSSLPQLTVANKGELVLNDKGEIGFAPWSSNKLDTATKVQIVQYMAARPAAESQVRPFTDALEAEKFPAEFHHVTTVVNLSDVTFGASGFALSQLESNKRRYPESSLVGDWNGIGQQQWGLERKSSALFILDAEGKLLFFKDGMLNAKEIEHAIGLIRQEVGKRAAS